MTMADCRDRSVLPAFRRTDAWAERATRSRPGCPRSETEDAGAVLRLGS